MSEQESQTTLRPEGVEITLQPEPSAEELAEFEASEGAERDAAYDAILAEPEGEQVLAVMPKDTHVELNKLSLFHALKNTFNEIYNNHAVFTAVVYDTYQQKVEFCGRYCEVCGDTTSHFRPRGVPKGHGPVYEKTVTWGCTPCFKKSETFRETVKLLMQRMLITGETE